MPKTIPPERALREEERLTYEVRAAVNMAVGAMCLAQLKINEIIGRRVECPPKRWHGVVMRHSEPLDGTLCIRPDPGADTAPWTTNDYGEISMTIHCLTFLPKTL